MKHIHDKLLLLTKREVQVRLTVFSVFQGNYVNKQE
jgi:hypothetical protein